MSKLGIVVAFGALVSVLVVVVFMFSFTKPNNEYPLKTFIAEPVNTSSSSVGSSEERQDKNEVEVKIETREYQFSPSEVTVKNNQKVKLTLENNGSFPHSFVIDELDVKSDIVSPGSKTLVEFTATKGVYEYYCGVDNHKDMGMSGKLIVE